MRTWATQQANITVGELKLVNEYPSCKSNESDAEEDLGQVRQNRTHTTAWFS